MVVWNEVFAMWKAEEEEIWRSVYTERGFASWEAWRQTYIDDLGLANVHWTYEVVAQPEREIPTWYIGGWRGWKPYRPEGEEFSTFGTVAASPLLMSNEKVQAIVRDMRPLRFILLRCGGDIAVLNGTHRAAAAALRIARGEVLPMAEAYIGDIPQRAKATFDAFRRDRMVSRGA